MINEIHGLFTINHLIIILLSIIIQSVILILSLKKNKEQIIKTIKYLGIFILIYEIIKIIYMIIDKRSINNYFPLYYCSLILYFIILIYPKNNKLNKIGYLLISYSGLIPSFAYIIYTITSINFHPLISFDTIHSFIYHNIMLYISLIIIIKKIHISNKNDYKIYLPVTISICIIVIIINSIFNTTFMYINKAPLDNPFLLSIQNIIGPFYPLFITISLTLGTYILTYIFSSLIQKER